MSTQNQVVAPQKIQIEVNAKPYLIEVDKLKKFKIFVPSNQNTLKHVSLFFEQYVLPLMLNNYTIYDLEINNITEFLNCCNELRYFQYDISEEEIRELYEKINMYDIVANISRCLNKKRNKLLGIPLTLTCEKTFSKRLERFKLEASKLLQSKKVSLDINVFLDDVKQLKDYTPLIKQDFEKNNIILKICIMFNQIVRNKSENMLGKQSETKFTLNLLKF